MQLRRGKAMLAFAPEFRGRLATISSQQYVLSGLV